MIEVANCALDLSEVHREVSAGVEAESTFVHQVIELQSHSLGVCLFQSKTKRTERRSQKGGVEFALSIGAAGKIALRLTGVHQRLQSEQSCDIGFGFFDGTVEFFQFLARAGIASVDRDLMRAEAMGQLMRNDVGKEPLEIQIFIGLRREHNLRDRLQDGAE